MSRWLCLAMPFLLSGCFAFSSFQSAAIVPPGELAYSVKPDGGYTSYAGTVGLAISTPFESVKIRPEVAWLGGVGSDDDEASSYRQFGIALEFSGKSDTTKTKGTDEPWW